MHHLCPFVALCASFAHVVTSFILPVCVSFVPRSVCLSLLFDGLPVSLYCCFSLPVCLFVLILCVYFYLSVHLSLSFYLFLCLSVFLFVSRSFFSVFFLFFCLSFCLYVLVFVPSVSLCLPVILLVCLFHILDSIFLLSRTSDLYSRLCFE